MEEILKIKVLEIYKSTNKMTVYVCEKFDENSKIKEIRANNSTLKHYKIEKPTICFSEPKSTSIAVFDNNPEAAGELILVLE